MKDRRRRRRAWMRADVIAPWVSLAVILTFGWLGMQTLKWLGVPMPPPGGANRPAAVASVRPSRADAEEPRLSAAPARASISGAPLRVSADDITTLRQKELEVPVKGIPRVALVSSFREPRAGDRQHEAMDILAPRGTEVVAVEDGRIAKLLASELGGITVYQFDPAERVVYYYAHLDRYAPGLAEGATARRGDVIGYVGTTGNAPPNTPHLHFAIYKIGMEKRWWDGVPIDPLLAWEGNR